MSVHCADYPTDALVGAKFRRTISEREHVAIGHQILGNDIR
jgi:hypothetical protein